MQIFFGLSVYLYKCIQYMFRIPGMFAIYFCQFQFCFPGVHPTRLTGPAPPAYSEYHALSLDVLPMLYPGADIRGVHGPGRIPGTPFNLPLHLGFGEAFYGDRS